MHVSVSIAITDRPTQVVSVSSSALDAVLFDFNPTSSPSVAAIKALHAALITELERIRGSEDSRPAQKRTAAIAITELEGTQMRSVKALFAK